MLKLGLTCLYVPSAHTPSTPRVPVVGTRFRVVGLVVARNNIRWEYKLFRWQFEDELPALVKAPPWALVLAVEADGGE